VAEAKVFRVSAEQGNPDAQYQLGLMYLEGRGVDRSVVDGLQWIRLAAHDHVDAPAREAIAAKAKR
jgi:TPR repeat protein